MARILSPSKGRRPASALPCRRPCPADAPARPLRPSQRRPRRPQPRPDAAFPPPGESVRWDGKSNICWARLLEGGRALGGGGMAGRHAGRGGSRLLAPPAPHAPLPRSTPPHLPPPPHYHPPPPHSLPSRWVCGATSFGAEATASAAGGSACEVLPSLGGVSTCPATAGGGKPVALLASPESVHAAGGGCEVVCGSAVGACAAPMPAPARN